MEILILNAGSSSLKFSLYNLPNFNLLARGVCERVGLQESFMSLTIKEQKIHIDKTYKNHVDALKHVYFELTQGKHAIKQATDGIELIGHMFVHGGGLTEPSFANKEIISHLKKSVGLAPIHLPKAISVLENATKLFPQAQNLIYFDSNFHSSIPKHANTYAINREITQKYNIKRYGFHGSSHEYMSQSVKKLSPKAKNIITCHLGNGCSISAIKNGKCIDTSMGFTPLEGVVMGTRCGNIDASIVNFIATNAKISTDKVMDILNNESGLKGICGYSDLRDIEKGASQNDELCILALDIYVYSIIKQIGAYICALQGVDAICFGGGVGENSPYIRKRILKDLQFLGIEFNEKLNETINRMPDTTLSTKNSKIEIYVISTNEEFIVANKLYSYYKNKI